MNKINTNNTNNSTNPYYYLHGDGRLEVFSFGTIGLIASLRHPHKFQPRAHKTKEKIASHDKSRLVENRLKRVSKRIFIHIKIRRDGLKTKGCFFQ